jgi:hypothetical protein
MQIYRLRRFVKREASDGGAFGQVDCRALEEPYSTMVWLHAVAIPRPSEGFAFKWSDLNTETNQLMVVRAVNRGQFHPPKCHRVNRPVQLTPADVQRLLALKKLLNASDSDWIFPSENPEAPLRHEDVLSRKIQPKAKELGLPPGGCCANGARHT